MKLRSQLVVLVIAVKGGLGKNPAPAAGDQRSISLATLVSLDPCLRRTTTGSTTDLWTFARLAPRSLALQPGNSLIGPQPTLSEASTCQLLSMLLSNSQSHLFITTAFDLDTLLFDVDTECVAQLRYYLAEDLTNASFA